MKRPPRLRAPYLKRISLMPERVERKAFPFNTLRFLTDDFQMSFEKPITIFVGENGSGKSTLLEGIATLCGFHAYGGSQDHQMYARDDSDRDDDEAPPRKDENAPPSLGETLRGAWLPKVGNGFFFRAESFFRLANYIDVHGRSLRHGGRKLHEQSHGESFLAMFEGRLAEGAPAMYLLDEPESALSPARQLALVRLMRRWEEDGNVQAIIATHAPILMAYPGARLLDFSRGHIREIDFEETEHFKVMRAFFADPRAYLEAEIAADE
jgi:predicted ATPase